MGLQVYPQKLLKAWNVYVDKKEHIGVLSKWGVGERERPVFSLGFSYRGLTDQYKLPSHSLPGAKRDILEYFMYVQREGLTPYFSIKELRRLRIEYDGSN